MVNRESDGGNENDRVKDWPLRSQFGDLTFIHAVVSTTLDLLGLGALTKRFEDLATMQALERVNLDGLLALWHPPAAN